jgi:hypothetical protein
MLALMSAAAAANLLCCSCSAGGTQEDPRCDCKPCPKTMLGSPVAGATNETACGGCEPGRGGIDCETCPENTYSLGKALMLQYENNADSVM